MKKDVSSVMEPKGKYKFIWNILSRCNTFLLIMYVYLYLCKTEKLPRIVLCSRSCPVWICEHAINLHHPCKFLYCNDCRTDEMAKCTYITRPKRNQGHHNDGTRLATHETERFQGKRARPNPVQYLDDNTSDIEQCNHNMASLEKLEDGAYFTEEYVMEKTANPDYHYASICHKCKGHVRDKVPA